MGYDGDRSTDGRDGGMRCVESRAGFTSDGKNEKGETTRQYGRVYTEETPDSWRLGTRGTVCSCLTRSSTFSRLQTSRTSCTPCVRRQPTVSSTWSSRNGEKTMASSGR
ncbi:unnamed protein product [Discosporangium mesarthrocarpum]